MVAIAKLKTIEGNGILHPEYAQADFTPKAVEREHYEATWLSKCTPLYLLDQINRTTFGWLLASMNTYRECDGRWTITASWVKGSDPHTIAHLTQDLSFDDLEYYHPGSTRKIRLYARTRLIPTLRILWLWLRLWIRRKARR